ncbi:hypothetical protein AKO1_012614 [Acrasis kona]|uniref:JmjC domain-containing protein n=1 Tax=Acrasis kona TaxID=1008807 RepID=A0AAW2YUS2_9EUKA
MDVKFVQDNMIRMLREVLYEEKFSKLLFSAEKDQVPQLNTNEPVSTDLYKYYITCSRPIIFTGPRALPGSKWQGFEKFTTEYLIEKAGKLKVIAEKSPTKVFPMFDTQSQVPVSSIQGAKPWFSSPQGAIIHRDRMLQIGHEVPSQQNNNKITKAVVDLLVRGQLIKNILYSGLEEKKVTTEEMTLEYYLTTKSKLSENWFLPPTRITTTTFAAKDFPHPPKFMDALTHLYSTLQISNDGHVVPLYQYNTETLIMQMRGSSLFIIFDPLQIEFLYPVPVRDYGELVISEIDPMNVDQHEKEEFQLYKNAFSLKVELKQGEVLYVPSHWWVYEMGNINGGHNVIIKQHFRTHSASFELLMRGLTKKNEALN